MNTKGGHNTESDTDNVHHREPPLNFALERPVITQSRPCNIQQYFTAVKMLIFR